MPISGQSVAGPEGSQNRDRIIFGGSAHQPRLVDIQPEGWYYYETQVLTIEFPVAGFEPYTLSVSSMYNTLDFYVTTPFVSVPINDTNVTIELQLETASGDMYYGSFEASSNTSTDWDSCLTRIAQMLFGHADFADIADIPILLIKNNLINSNNLL